ncbi:MAG: branched-chain amino acid ABC transporter permease [Anaerolineales bacterium]|nr:branched-chain amino acid ABC transporter permease [Anaerolineales bacterium]
MEKQYSKKSNPLVRAWDGLQGWIERQPVIGSAILLLALPFFLPNTLATNIVIYSLLAASFNLLIGYTGILSLGHSTCFGLGAYAAGLLLAKTPFVNLWLAIAAAVVVAAIAAAIMGWFALRRRLIYFAMLTLAFNQMVYYIVFQAVGLTGGDDGLRGIVIPNLQLPGINLSLDFLKHPYSFYYMACAVVIVCLYIMLRVIQSPFGRALESIRESEERALAVGYNTNRMQLVAFIIGSSFAGVAGAMIALLHGYVAVEYLSWVVGAAVIVMTVLGGKGTFIGPLVGAGIYMTLEYYISRETTSWQLYLGVLFVLIVLFLPQGLWGTFKQWYSRRRGKQVIQKSDLYRAEAEVEHVN